jgi:peroxin-19
MSETKPDPSGSDSSAKPDVATSNQHVTAAVDEVPDPDEDDLDDLDDMLEEFSTVKIDGSKPAAALEPEKPSTSKSTASKPAIPMIPTLAGDVPAIDPNDFSDEEFQRQLQAGMAELMGDLDTNVSLLQGKPKPHMVF